jgi:hypothetical protein
MANRLARFGRGGSHGGVPIKEGAQKEQRRVKVAGPVFGVLIPSPLRTRLACRLGPIGARRTLAEEHATETTTVEASPVSRRPRRQFPAAATGAAADCAPSSDEPERGPGAASTRALSRPHVGAVLGLDQGATRTARRRLTSRLEDTRARPILPSPATRAPAAVSSHAPDGAPDIWRSSAAPCTYAEAPRTRTGSVPASAERAV